MGKRATAPLQAQGERNLFLTKAPLVLSSAHPEFVEGSKHAGATGVEF